MQIIKFHAFSRTAIGILLLFMASTCVVEQPTFERLARDYADYMIEQGTDRYGPTSTPVFVSMLNRHTDSIFRNPIEEIYFDRDETGIRLIDRSWNATNPFNDEALYELLYELSDDTGNERYADAADASLKWIIMNTQHPETGLIGWGEHLGYMVDKESIVRHPESKWADLKHELHGYWSLWDRVFALAPEQAVQYADAQWQYHVYDKANGIHAHQTRWDTYLPDEGYVFPRMAGHMIYLWALAYTHAEDPRVKADMCRYIDKIVSTHNRKRYEPFMALCFYHPSEGIMYRAGSNLEAAYDVYRAKCLPLPDSLLAKLETFNRYEDMTLTYAQSQIQKGVVGDMDTLGNILSSGSTNLWCNSYGKATSLARKGLRFTWRSAQNHDETFQSIALEIADQYLGTTPDCNRWPLWPYALSAAIDLQLWAYQVTGEAAYLEQAERFGWIARDLYMDQTSPLPKVFPAEYDHYEAITGGPDLMLSFYHLGRALDDR